MTVSFTVFGTPIGPCGVAWRGELLVGTTLPEGTEARTRARLRARFPDAVEVPVSAIGANVPGGGPSAGTDRGLISGAGRELVPEVGRGSVPEAGHELASEAEHEAAPEAGHGSASGVGRGSVPEAGHEPESGVGREAAAETRHGCVPESGCGRVPDVVRVAVAGIVALLGGERRDLAEVGLDFSGVPEFNRRAYEVARVVPPGKTVTYGDIAHRLGMPGSAQAVGQAMGHNPFPIVVPCHRVLAAGGKDGGFSAHGGVQTKRAMLVIEGAIADEPTLF